MKILLATDTWSPVVNGVVRSVELLYHQLLALGHEVRVVTLSSSGHSYEENGILYVGSLSAERVYPGVRISAAGALPVSRWLDELEAWGPEVIHTQSEFSTFVMACRLAKRCHCPLVHTYHTVYEDYTQYLFPSERLGKATVEHATRLVAGHCALLLAPTDKVRALLNSYGVGCPVVTVPTGIDLKAFGPVQDGGVERAEMRRSLGIPEDAPVLLSLGRLAAEKNHARLLDLLAAEPAETRPWLVFVGDGPARPDLEEKTKQLGLQERVRFAGMVKPDEVAKWYRVGDLFVSASQSETQGLTYFEAMACGLPVLCRADPCLDGVVENGVNGWQWKDENEFSEALHTMTADSALREKMKQNALETAARYSAEHFARQVLDAYRFAIDSYGGGHPSPKSRNSLTNVTGAATALGFFLCLWLAVWAWRAGLLTDMQALQGYVRTLGWWAPSVFVLFQAVQVIVPILPGGIGCLAGAVLFGPWLGFLYNYLGICFGSLAAFAVARHCGRPLLEKMFSQKLLVKYQKWTGKGSHFNRWFALAIFSPVAPDDFLCYLAGTTAMEWRTFTAIIFTCKPFAIAAYSTGLTVAMNALLAM